MATVVWLGALDTTGRKCAFLAGGPAPEAMLKDDIKSVAMVVAALVEEARATAAPGVAVGQEA
jgi:hypothetical protein